MRVRIIRGTIHSGGKVHPGEIIDVIETDARRLVALDKAEYCAEAPKPAPLNSDSGLVKKRGRPKKNAD